MSDQFTQCKTTGGKSGIETSTLHKQFSTALSQKGLAINDQPLVKENFRQQYSKVVLNTLHTHKVY